VVFWYVQVLTLLLVHDLIETHLVASYFFINFVFSFAARDPNQVFVLLENIYGAFDELAARRRIFKVETIGDSYVAGK
jgi:Adenylate and Guanylate cyclase catalytic domain